MDELIIVRQLPIIEEHLKDLKASVEQSAAEAVSMVCTPETLTAVKAVRADLSKQLAAMEDRRKTVRRDVMAPYERFAAVYEECVSQPLRAADAQLKKKISEVEQTIRDSCEAEMRDFFKEATSARHLDWLTYDRMGLNISLTAAKQKTHKNLMEQITAFVTGVSDDVDSIEHMEGADEIMVEYKRGLSLSAATATVFERHRRIAEERAAAEAQQEAKAAEAEAVAKVMEAAAQAQPLAPPVADPVPVTDPTPVKMYQAVFTVHGTIDQLRALKEFMNKEGIRYE